MKEILSKLILYLIPPEISHKIIETVGDEIFGLEV